MAQSLYRQASLIMNPYGAKDTLLPSIKPTDGSGDFTFSRDGSGASPATRVNASGLIEKGRANELLYSQDFTNAAWVALNATKTTGQTDPNGGSTAVKIVSTAVVNSGLYQQDVSGMGSGLIRTSSVWLKGESGGEVVQFGDATNRTQVTLTTDWVRYEGFASDDSTFFVIYNIGSVQTWYAAFAQYEDGLVATDYIETTTAPVSAGLLGDMPRLDYSGGATCPSLLLEPSRTNAFNHSEYSAGIEYNNVNSVTNNAGISPEGVQNALEIDAAANDIADSYRNVGSGVVATFSVFAKAGTGDSIRMAHAATGSSAYADFNLTSGTKGTTGGAQYIDADIEEYGNGWYRCYITFTSGTGAYINRITFQDTGTYQLYGFQLEAGSYPTSYIPTYGSASTRGADFGESVFTENTLAPTGGTTLFIEFESSGEVDTTPNTGGFYLKNNAGTLSHFGMSFGYGDRIYSNYATGGTIIWDGSIVENTTHKVAFQFTQGGKSFLDGTTKATTSVDWSTKAMGQFEMQYGSKVKQAILFPSILTDAECIALTQI